MRNVYAHSGPKLKNPGQGRGGDKRADGRQGDSFFKREPGHEQNKCDGEFTEKIGVSTEVHPPEENALHGRREPAGTRE